MQELQYLDAPSKGVILRDGSFHGWRVDDTRHRPHHDRVGESAFSGAEIAAKITFRAPEDLQIMVFGDSADRCQELVHESIRRCIGWTLDTQLYLFVSGEESVMSMAEWERLCHGQIVSESSENPMSSENPASRELEDEIRQYLEPEIDQLGGGYVVVEPDGRIGWFRVAVGSGVIIGTTKEEAKVNMRHWVDGHCDPCGIYKSVFFKELKSPESEESVEVIERGGKVFMRNPPWASKIYADVCDEIHEKVEALGLPMPMEDVPTSRRGGGETCVLDPELGAGHYGVVYRTVQNDTVFKITTDETEAHFVSLLGELRARGVNPSGIVRYYGIFGVEATHRGRPVYVLWRESAEHVGKVSNVFCGEQYSGAASAAPDPYLCKQYQIFARLLGAWQKICGLAREIYLGTKKKADPEEFWRWVDQQMQSIEREQVWELGDSIWEKYSEHVARSYWGAEAMDALGAVKQRLARHPYKFAILVHIASRIAEEMTNENVAYQVGRTFDEYLEAGILMADVHLGNLGFVAERPDDNDFAPSMPVITDPGHVLILKRELSQAHIERL